MLDIHLFADDSNLIFADKSLLNLERVVNQELSKVNDWLCANKLTMNIDKSNYVIFSSPQKKINCSLYIVIINRLREQKKESKYLGIILDHYLNWKSHIH